MEDPEAKGGKLPLHPKTQQEDEAAASIDDAGDQYHLAGPQILYATTLLFGNNHPLPQANQSHGDDQYPRGTGEAGNNGHVLDSIPVLRNEAFNGGGSVVYGPYGLENARSVTDQYPLHGLPSNDTPFGRSTTADENNVSREEQDVSHKTEANDTTFLTSTTEVETYANHEQRDANNSSVLPVTTDNASLLLSITEDGNNAVQEQRDASHETDTNPYADYVFDRIPVGPGKNDLSANNLPPILHRLEKLKKEKRPELGTVNVDNQTQFGPTGKPLNIIPSLPRRISYHVNGWILEYLRREDDMTSAGDIISRMDLNEAKFSHARELRDVAKLKAKQGNSKKEFVVGEELADWEAPDLTKPENVDKIGNNFNMKRDRECREPLNLLSWERRRPFPTKKDCIRIDKLTDAQIKHNTTLEVTEQGLQRVRLVGGSGEKKRAEPIEGSYLPLDFYLENSEEHVPGVHIAKALEVLKDLKQKAEAKKLSHWTNLGVDDWPEQWRKQSRSLESTLAKKRKAKGDAKAEEDVANDAETGRLNGQKIAKAMSRPAKKAKSNQDSKSAAAVATGPQQTQNGPHLASYIGYPPPSNHGHGMARENVNYRGQVGQTLSQASRYVPHVGQVGSPLPHPGRYVPHAGQIGSTLPPVAPGYVAPGHSQVPMTNSPSASPPGMYAVERADPAMILHHYPPFAQGPANRGNTRQPNNLDMSFINDPTQRPGDRVEDFYRAEVRQASRERLGVNATPAEIRADMRDELEVRIGNPGTAQWLKLLLQQIKDDLAK